MFFFIFFVRFFVEKKKMLTFAMCLCIYEDFLLTRVKL